MKIGILCALLVYVLGCVSCGSGSGSHAVGLSCKADADCLSGLYCVTADVGGQCEKMCTPLMDATCGDPTLSCNFEGHCHPKCTQTSDCARAAEGYFCKDDTPARSVKYCDSP